MPPDRVEHQQGASFPVFLDRPRSPWEHRTRADGGTPRAVRQRFGVSSCSGVTKFLLLGILLATFLIPLGTARIRDPRRGLWTTLALIAVAEVAYAMFLVFLYPHHV